MSNAPKQLSNARVSVFGLNSTGPIEALAVVQMDSTGGIVSGAPGGGSTQVSVKEILTSSGASVMDSTAGAIKVNVVAGSAAGDTTVTARSYQSTAADLNAAVVQGSTTWITQSKLFSSSGGDLVVSTATPGSNTQGLIVRQVGTVDISPVSTASVRVQQSTAGDLLASVQQNSTVWAVQVDGRVRAQNSTVGDLLVTAYTYTSSGGAVEGSTTTPSTGSVLGLNVRPVQPSGRQSTSILVRTQDAGGSTTLISSAAGLKHCVYAYAVTTTLVGVSSCTFNSSAASEVWGLLLGSGSSGISGANLATAPPGFLFQTQTANALNFVASSTGLYRVSITWFTEA